MKKVILTISVMLIALIACLSMMACNNTATTQGQLCNILSDHKSEKFVYDVFAKDDIGNKTEGYDGTYTVTLQAYSDGSSISNFGSQDTKLENLSAGILVKGLLTVGAQTYDTGCYFTLINGSSYMVPAYSYRVQKNGETETLRVFGSYDGKKYSYTRTVNGEKSEGTIEAASATYYDNNEFHQALRTITTFSDSLSFGFSVPLVSATEASSVSLTASVNGKTKVTTAFTESNEKYADNGIECYKTSVSRATEVAGISQTLYYATGDVLINGWAMKHVLVKIEEPFKHDGKTFYMNYELKTAELA
ncbi:MAG TPA: hypothetical protein DEF02_00590 [Clostridiales bacterium]|nr:hypothetical protein [Clostridiales bacterium]